jgi:hypothetical protein
MKEITLASGRKLVIAPLTVKQGRQMGELVDQGQFASASVGACVRALNNAKADENGATLTVEAFEEEFTIPEANELFKLVAEISELKVGESTASR